ncbi:unnamed protein product [Durusdinium trenchii]|uniref:ShKT domain-containing protein n=1 Tax=Durusdinium trenchii TaxID=1381693 RepID=A0ABP0JTV2_9DINO
MVAEGCAFPTHMGSELLAFHDGGQLLSTEECALACVLEENCTFFESNDTTQECRIKVGGSLFDASSDCDASPSATKMYERKVEFAFADFKEFRLAATDPAGVRLELQWALLSTDRTCFHQFLNITDHVVVDPEHTTWAEACQATALDHPRCARWVVTDALERCDCMLYDNPPTTFNKEPACGMIPFAYVDASPTVSLWALDVYVLGAVLSAAPWQVFTTVDPSPVTYDFAALPRNDLDRCVDVLESETCAGMTTGANTGACANPLFATFLASYCAATCGTCILGPPGTKCLGGDVVNATTDQPILEPCLDSGVDRRVYKCNPNGIMLVESLLDHMEDIVCYMGLAVHTNSYPIGGLCFNNEFVLTGEQLSCPRTADCAPVIWYCADDVPLYAGATFFLGNSNDYHCTFGQVVNSPDECLTSAPTAAPTIQPPTGFERVLDNSTQLVVSASSALACCGPENAVGVASKTWTTPRYPVDESAGPSSRRLRRSRNLQPADVSLWEVAETAWEPQYMQVADDVPSLVIAYRLATVSEYLDFAPVDWYFLGSNDEKYWVILDHQKGFVWDEDSTGTFFLEVPATFLSYRLVIEEVTGDGTFKAVVLDSILFFGDQIVVTGNKDEDSGRDESKSSNPADTLGIPLLAGAASGLFLVLVALGFAARTLRRGSGSRANRRFRFLNTFLHVQPVGASQSQHGNEGSRAGGGSLASSKPSDGASISGLSVSKGSSSNGTLSANTLHSASTITAIGSLGSNSTGSTGFSRPVEAIKGGSGVSGKHKKKSGGTNATFALELSDPIPEPTIWLGYSDYSTSESFPREPTQGRKNKNKGKKRGARKPSVSGQSVSSFL